MWGVRRLSFREIPSSTLGLDQPRLPKWFIRLLTAIWPIELIFTCSLAASVAVVVWGDERNVVQLLRACLKIHACANRLVINRMEAI